MVRELYIEDLRCLCATAGDHNQIAYVLYPLDMLRGWIEEAARRYGVAIVVITGMDWQNVFSPWPAKGVPKGTPDFLGHSPEFLSLLQQKVVPQVETALGISPGAERTLVGVSMSGLFALWQWAVCDTFRNIGSMSGSFWFEGFADWFASKDLKNKTGKAFFLLGDQESKARAFHTVAENTAQIVAELEKQGVDAEFRSVPGNHYSDPLPRLETTFGQLFG
ncbi:MAG: alpha/beta hydrolase-fold protein [Clostridium sp.]|nr:alpha/beta hydrolase-fold protein [Clostridium sp.]